MAIDAGDDSRRVAGDVAGRRLGTWADFRRWDCFVNLFALPLLCVCMALGGATLAIGFFWPALGQIAGWTAWLSFSTLEKITAFFAALPGSSIDLPRPALWTLLAYVAPLVWLWIVRERDVDSL